MTQRLHLVFGGELVDPASNVFRNVEDIHIVGMYPNYAQAFDAWKAEAQRTVDNAHMRYFIAHLHRLRDEEAPAGPTEGASGRDRRNLMPGFWTSLTIFIDGRGNRGGVPALPAPGPVRPEGPSIWFLCPDAAAVDSLGGLLGHVAEMRPDVEVVISCPVGAGRASIGDPGDSYASVRAELARMRPEVLVLVGTPFRVAAVAAAEDLGIPVVGLALRGSDRSWLTRWPFRGLGRRHLARFRRLMCEDAVAEATMLKVGAPRERTEITGLLASDVTVLPCNEAEREELSEAMTSRPVWCASNLPMAELPAILAAHRQVLQRSHRLLLVIVPLDPAEGPAMRDAIVSEGWVVGLRSEGEEPVDDIPVYVADLGGELGLWLRLAPIAWIGGTHDPRAVSLSPMQVAALGSAILHGPSTGGFATEYARLASAGAARMARTPEEIAAAVDILIAPDEAATMAHAAWEVSSAGEDAAARAVEVLLEYLPAEQP